MSGHPNVGAWASPTPDATQVHVPAPEAGCSTVTTSGYRLCRFDTTRYNASSVAPWTADELRAAMTGHSRDRLAGPFVTTVRAGVRGNADHDAEAGLLVRVESDPHGRSDGWALGSTDGDGANERIVVERVINADGPWRCIDVVTTRSDAPQLGEIDDGSLGPPTPFVIERTTWVIHDGDGTAEAEFTSDVSTNLVTGDEHHNLFARALTDWGRVLTELATTRRLPRADQSASSVVATASTTPALTTPASTTPASTTPASGVPALTATASTTPAPSPSDERLLIALFDALAAAVAVVERATEDPEWRPTHKALRTLSMSIGMLSGAATVVGTDAELSDSLDRLYRQVLAAEALSGVAKSMPELRSTQSRIIGASISEHSGIERFEQSVADRLDEVRCGVGEHLRELADSSVRERFARLPSTLVALPSAPERCRELLLGAAGAWRKGTRHEQSRAARRVLQQAVLLSVATDAKRTRVWAEGVARSTRALVSDECWQRLLRDLADGTTSRSPGDAVSENLPNPGAQQLRPTVAERSLLLVIGAHAELSARQHRKHRRSLTECLDRIPQRDGAAH